MLPDIENKLTSNIHLNRHGYTQKYHRQPNSKNISVNYSRGGVEDPRLEAKAKARTQKNPRPRPRTAHPRTDPLKAKGRNARGQGQEPRTQAQVFSKKFFRRSQKKVFKKIFASARDTEQGSLCSSLCQWSSSVGHWCWYTLDQKYGPKLGFGTRTAD